MTRRKRRDCTNTHTYHTKTAHNKRDTTLKRKTKVKSYIQHTRDKDALALAGFEHNLPLLWKWGRGVHEGMITHTYRAPKAEGAHTLL